MGNPNYVFYCVRVEACIITRMRISPKLVLVFLLLAAAEPQADGYLDTLPKFWKNLYPQGGSTLYCGKSFRPFDPLVNVEHVFPMSWVTRALRCGKREQCRRTSARFNAIESDMHNFYPALKTVNQLRSSYAYKIIPGEKSAYAGCDFELENRRVEPRPEARGKIARAMLYMADRYPVKLHDQQRRLMLQWHVRYPPGRAEKRRNRRIREIQGNGNPYIEHPSIH